MVRRQPTSRASWCARPPLLVPRTRGERAGARRSKASTRWGTRWMETKKGKRVCRREGVTKDRKSRAWAVECDVKKAGGGPLGHKGKKGGNE